MKSGKHVVYCCWSTLSLYQSIECESIKFALGNSDELKDVEEMEETIRSLESNVEAGEVDPEKVEKGGFQTTLGVIEALDKEDEEQEVKIRGGILDPPDVYSGYSGTLSEEDNFLIARVSGNLTGKNLTFEKEYLNAEDPPVVYTLERIKQMNHQNVYIGNFSTEVPQPPPSIKERFGFTVENYLEEKPKLSSLFEGFNSTQKEKFWQKLSEKEWAKPFSAVVLTSFLDPSDQDFSVELEEAEDIVNSVATAEIRADIQGKLDTIEELFGRYLWQFSEVPEKMEEDVCSLINNIA